MCLGNNEFQSSCQFQCHFRINYILLDQWWSFEYKGDKLIVVSESLVDWVLVVWIALQLDHFCDFYIIGFGCSGYLS